MAFAPDRNEYQGNSEQLGDWYNDLGDLAGDIKSGAEWLYNQAKSAQNQTRTAVHVADNAANITAWRLDGNTVVFGGAALVALYFLLNRRR